MCKPVLRDLKPLCEEVKPETLEKTYKNIHGMYSWQFKVNMHYADILF